jgi:hypothetical protein
VLLALLVAAVPAAVQAAPPARINNLVGRANFTVQDRNRIQDWAEYWSDTLQHAGPEEAREASQALVDPVGSPVLVSEVFRLEYTKAALPGLQQIIATHNPLTTGYAMRVVGMLGTPDAMEVLLDHCDVADEKDFGTRLWAAKAISIAIGLNTLGQNDVNRALRRLGRAAGRETEWLILRRQFEAVATVRSNVSREVYLAILEKTTERMAEQNDGPSELMGAAYPALVRIRNAWLDLPPLEQEKFGPKLAPILCDVCTVAQKHWDKAQDSSLKDAYGGAISISEILLTMIIDQQAGAGPTTSMSRYWKERDKPRFADDHDKWKAILRQPPFKQP